MSVLFLSALSPVWVCKWPWELAAMTSRGPVLPPGIGQGAAPRPPSWAPRNVVSSSCPMVPKPECSHAFRGFVLLEFFLPLKPSTR